MSKETLIRLTKYANDLKAKLAEKTLSKKNKNSEREYRQFLEEYLVQVTSKIETLKMKTINIDESVVSVTPQEFLTLEQGNYRLVKIVSTRESNPFIGVSEGDAVIGPLSIVNVAGLNLPGVKVLNEGLTSDLKPTYIRTSPIVKVIDKSERTITFKTQGGIYNLERVLDN